MLSDPDRDIIAHSIDGSLDRPGRKRMRALWRESRDARKLYRALRREQIRLGRLPKGKAPSELLPAVMARVEELNVWTTIPSAARPDPIRPRLIPYAIAASILAIVTLVASWSAGQYRQRELSFAQLQALPAFDGKTPPVPDEPRTVADASTPSDILPLEPKVEPAAVEIAPLPRVAADNAPRPAFGAPPVPPLKLDTVLVKLPLLATMPELTRDDVKKQLAKELARGPQVRVDLFSRDSFRAAELLVAISRAMDISVTFDETALARLRTRTPTSWLLYTDSLTAEEATQLLTRLAAVDSKSGEIFQSLHVPGAGNQDQKDLKDLLGIDLKSKPSKAAAKPAAGEKPKAKSAILVSYLPPSARVNPAQSRELKSWLEARGERQPGTIGLSIVVR